MWADAPACGDLKIIAAVLKALAIAKIFTLVGLQGTADLQVRDGVIEIRAIHRNPREGWADDAQRLAAQGGDVLVWPEVANEGDDKLVW